MTNSEEINYNYLDLLNPQQREAVVYKDGPALVIAGAGSGKTRVLTYKIVDLLRSGFEPYRILALTFTNKAAREMKERVAALVGEKVSSRLWMGTFHSIFLRILRQHAELIGFRAGFTIYDTTDSKTLVKNIIKELSLDDKAYKTSTVLSTISNAKNALVTAEQYNADADYYQQDKRAKRPLTGKIYSIYCQRCKNANAMDFDDILFYMNTLLRDNPDIKRHYQEFFRYILVDEYQDTNFAQHLIISQLSTPANRLCVVGDDAQSIYSFRGANIGNIINMKNRYPDLRTFKLERNYRSTKNIVDAAGSLIAKNTGQLKKHTFSENDAGEKIKIVKTYSDMEEAYIVANMISQSKLTHHDSYDEYAVLYRTNAQSRILEESLRKRNIPYRIYGGLSFYQRKEIKDVICYFRLSINPDDDEALRRVINYPARGIGETTMRKLQSVAAESGVSMWNVLCSPHEYSLPVNSGTMKKLEGFRAMMQEFVTDNESGANAFSLAQLIYNRTRILAQLAHDNTPESISKKENLTELLSGLKDFTDMKTETGDDASMRAFLSEVMLATDQDESDTTDEPKVTMMTVHAAKGLEFKHIFIVGVEEELFPSALSMDSLAQIEEERRLLYVAITRAKTTCTISYAGSRFRNGQTVISKPSRFLSDIDTRYIRLVSSGTIGSQESEFPVNPVKNYGRSTTYSPPAYGSGSYRTSGFNTVKPSGSPAGLKKVSAAMSSSSAAGQSHKSSEVAVGTRILHKKFGEGTVVKLDSISGSDTITVDFDTVGTKKLLLRFAVFDIIG